VGLASAGQELTERRLKVSQYCGPAPVSLQSYTAAVNAQIPKVALTHDLLRKALSDLVTTEEFSWFQSAFDPDRTIRGQSLW